KVRETEKADTMKKIEGKDLLVTKRSGQLQKFSLDKIKKTLSFAARGYENLVDLEGMALSCLDNLYDKISTKEVGRALVMTARALIEQDPAYSRIASRLLLRLVYKEVIGPEIDYQKFDEQYREAFKRNVRRAVEVERLDKRYLEFDLDKMASRLRPERDELLMYLGAQTLYDRYFLRDVMQKEIFETPQAFWMRVAMGVSLLEADKNGRALEFYEAISTLRYVPASPTLFHGGLPRAQLSSCFLSAVGDDLSQIFKTFSDNAQLLKWAGGVGVDWTAIRGTGSVIKSTGVESQGVIPFLKIMNDTTISINRSGRKRGAACVYLENWHYDFEDFLDLRKNTGDERRRTHDIDTAAWIPDLFMKRVKEDGEWTLFSPDETPDLHEIYGRKFEERYTRYEQMAREGNIHMYKTLKARDLWKKMLSMLFETGHPWVTFKDPSNIRSPQDHAGVVHSSNLCTEITLNTSADEIAVCNLGSINFAQHVRGGRLDTELLKYTVMTAMRMLDNVIDINFYPVSETKNSNMRHRPVGLGVMGIQDAMYLLGVNFDSEEAVMFADRSMELVSYYAILTSSLLAKERGTYPSYKGSKWDRGIFPQDTLDLLEGERGVRIDVARGGSLDWAPVRESVRQYGMRNSNCLAIAPTATISNIAGGIPAMEPIYKNIYVKANMSGDFTVVNPYLVEDLKKLGLWDYEMLGKLKYYDGSIRQITSIPEHIRAKYKEVFEINPRWLVKAAAYRAKWIDQSQSFNIFYSGSSGKEVGEIYQYAWEMGLKTTYYLRTLAASQVEKSTVDTAEFGSTHKRQQPSDMPLEKPKVFMAEPAAKLELSLATSAAPSRVAVGAHAFSAALTPAAGTHAALSAKMPKLCLIDDPNCESCQ
ncbi:MAG: ribonucleoside-diphosphate reductase subunit alpha, partial [Patescibacteria group bacterium]